MKKLIFFLFILLAQQTMAQQTKHLKNEYHQFDFWLGKWDVYIYGTDTLAGKSHIESIIDSVGLQENYSVVNGKYTGKSFNKYNPEKKRWEQYWIDNSGLTLFLTGSFINGKMILDDTEYGDSKKGLNQIVWEKMENGSVRQTWNVSNDKGKTWSTVFDGEYKRTDESE
ncbi:MAG: hypothetical protein QE487_09230 [Fluviicola sp.]|nr:hypothetical protein [Fluviicola sp.]